jgi:hypothetical protein
MSMTATLARTGQGNYLLTGSVWTFKYSIDARFRCLFRCFTNLNLSWLFQPQTVARTVRAGVSFRSTSGGILGAPLRPPGRYRGCPEITVPGRLQDLAAFDLCAGSANDRARVAPPGARRGLGDSTPVGIAESCFPRFTG